VNTTKELLYNEFLILNKNPSFGEMGGSPGRGRRRRLREG